MNVARAQPIHGRMGKPAKARRTRGVKSGMLDSVNMNCTEDQSAADHDGAFVAPLAGVSLQKRRGWPRWPKVVLLPNGHVQCLKARQDGKFD